MASESQLDPTQTVDKMLQDFNKSCSLFSFSFTHARHYMHRDDIRGTYNLLPWSPSDGEGVEQWAGSTVSASRAASPILRIPMIHLSLHMEQMVRGHFGHGDSERVERAWTLAARPLPLLKQPSFEVHKLLRKRSHVNLSQLFNALASTVLQPIVSYDFGSAFRPTKESVALLKQLDEAGNKSSLGNQHIMIRANNPKIRRSFAADEPFFDSNGRFEAVPDDPALDEEHVTVDDTKGCFDAETMPLQSREKMAFTADAEVLADAVPFVRRKVVEDDIYPPSKIQLELQEPMQFPVENRGYEKAIATECNANFISSKGPELQPTPILAEAHPQLHHVVFLRDDSVESIAAGYSEFGAEPDGMNSKKKLLVVGTRKKANTTFSANHLYPLLYLPLPKIVPALHVSANTELNGDNAMKVEEAAVTTVQVFDVVMKLSEWANELAGAQFDELTEISEEL
uniref:Uncharacterized protein n=1 Tax=Mycena chlorophos TaxID=658473 RepID=A0ABQ0LHY7_MYCCL|nr:predicted protein [Mycena chlorophos]